MSNTILNRVFSESRSKGGERLCLLTLADRSDDDGICFPGLSDIAKRAHLGKRQAQRCIQNLVASGELIILVPGRGVGHPNRYLVAVGCAEAKIRAIIEREKASSATSFNDSRNTSSATPFGDSKGDISDTQKATFSTSKGVASDAEIRHGCHPNPQEPAAEPPDRTLEEKKMVEKSAAGKTKTATAEDQSSGPPRQPDAGPPPADTERVRRLEENRKAMLAVFEQGRASEPPKPSEPEKPEPETEPPEIHLIQRELLADGCDESFAVEAASRGVTLEKVRAAKTKIDGMNGTVRNRGGLYRRFLGLSKHDHQPSIGAG